jgi:lysophospholipase L1-like esterase
MSESLVVVAFGDSTTAPREGVTVYTELLQSHWQERQPPVRVVNAGVQGDDTRRARARFRADVLANSPTLVIFLFGIHDATVDLWESPPAIVPRVPLSSFCDNLVSMAKTLRVRGSIPVFCTPTPLAWSEETLRLYGASPYLPNDVDGFNVLLYDYVAAIHELAGQLAIPLVDLDAAFRQYESDAVPPWQSLLLDGMHPNDEGHLLMARLMSPLLDDILESLT